MKACFTNVGDRLATPSPRLSAQHTALSPLLSLPGWPCSCGHLPGHLSPFWTLEGVRPGPLAWVGLQASWRGSQELGVGVETTLVAHPPKTLGLRGHLLCGLHRPPKASPLSFPLPQRCHSHGNADVTSLGYWAT